MGGGRHALFRMRGKFRPFPQEGYEELPTDGAIGARGESSPVGEPKQGGRLIWAERPCDGSGRGGWVLRQTQSRPSDTISLWRATMVDDSGHQLQAPGHSGSFKDRGS